MVPIPETLTEYEAKLIACRAVCCSKSLSKPLRMDSQLSPRRPHRIHGDSVFNIYIGNEEITSEENERSGLYKPHRTRPIHSPYYWLLLCRRKTSVVKVL